MPQPSRFEKKKPGIGPSPSFVKKFEAKKKSPSIELRGGYSDLKKPRVDREGWEDERFEDVTRRKLSRAQDPLNPRRG